MDYCAEGRFKYVPTVMDTLILVREGADVAFAFPALQAICARIDELWWC